jgi:hypothetical protein
MVNLLCVPADPDKIQSITPTSITPTSITPTSMTPTSATAWDDLRQELARDVDRVSDRLRGLSQARLAAAAPPHSSRAQAARATAQALTDASTGFEARADPAAPAWRTLPELGDFAAGDLVAVTGHDLVAAAGLAAPHDRVWTRPGRRTAQEVLTEAGDALAALRRLL